MAIYRVTYRSMTARYGPSFIEATGEAEAKRQFGDCFSNSERAFCTAREVSPDEVRRALEVADLARSIREEG
jgi:hypothetical protein